MCLTMRGHKGGDMSKTGGWGKEGEVIPVTRWRRRVVAYGGMTCYTRDQSLFSRDPPCAGKNGPPQCLGPLQEGSEGGNTCAWDSRASTGKNRIRMYGMRKMLEVKLRTRAHRTSSHLRLACNAVQALLLRSVMTSVLFIDWNSSLK